jgi:hypothetical protein
MPIGMTAQVSRSALLDRRCITPRRLRQSITRPLHRPHQSFMRRPRRLSIMHLPHLPHRLVRPRLHLLRFTTHPQFRLACHSGSHCHLGIDQGHHVLDAMFERAVHRDSEEPRLST